MNTADTGKRIGFFGECMVELKGDPEQPMLPTYAGDTFNSALYFNRLASPNGWRTHYLTALGHDAFSETMLKRWRAERLDCEYVARLADKLPGLYYIEVDADGERSFSYWRSQSAARYYFSAPDFATFLPELESLDALYLSGISLAITPEPDLEQLFQLIEALKARGGKVFFDNNYRPALWPDSHRARTIYQRVLELTDTAFLTLEDERLLFDSDSSEAVFARLANTAIEEIVIKRGSQDCVILSGEDLYTVPAQPVANVVDTTAAGDAFSAAYLAARLNGRAVAEAAEAGHTLAATVIQHEGAIIAPTKMPKGLTV